MTAYISCYAYDPAKGADTLRRIPIDFDGASFKTQEEAAKGLHQALCKLAETMGQCRSEVALWSPENNNFCSGQWGVCWESGPYEWAIGLSMHITGPWGFTEPYYGFDLHFTE